MPMIYEAETQAKLNDWVVRHRSDYIQSGGAKGHIMDMRFIGGYRFEPMLLLRYTGRKSGKQYINGLGYTNYGGDVVIAASKGGSDTHPAWYLNIKDGSPLAFQVGTQAFDASWREAEGDEYEEIWRYVTKQNPIFTQYRKATTRKIPLIVMTPLEEIAVFTE